MAARTRQCRDASAQRHPGFTRRGILGSVASRSRSVHGRFSLGVDGHDWRRCASQYASRSADPRGRQFRASSFSCRHVRMGCVAIGAFVTKQERCGWRCSKKWRPKDQPPGLPAWFYDGFDQPMEPGLLARGYRRPAKRDAQPKLRKLTRVRRLRRPGRRRLDSRFFGCRQAGGQNLPATRLAGRNPSHHFAPDALFRREAALDDALLELAGQSSC